MKFLSVLAAILVIVGALNWGLWGLFQFDFVAWFSGGNTTMLARLIYSIVGLAGVWSLGRWKCLCGCCGCGKGGSGSCK